MKSRVASTTISVFLTFSILSFLNFVEASNGYNPDQSLVQCPPPPPCICNPISPPPLPPSDTQPPTTQPPLSPNAQPLPSPPPPSTTQPPLAPNTQPLSPPTTTPPPPLTTQPPPSAQPSPLPANTPPPPLATTPPPPPPLDGICTRNDTELRICNRSLVISQNIIRDGREVPCCSIIRDLSDVDALTCLCNSVEARCFSFSPNINNFFRACGRRVPQGFSCPGPSPTIPPPPLPPTTPPSPPPTMPPPALPANTPPPLSPITPPPIQPPTNQPPIPPPTTPPPPPTTPPPPGNTPPLLPPVTFPPLPPLSNTPLPPLATTPPSPTPTSPPPLLPVNAPTIPPSLPPPANTPLPPLATTPLPPPILDGICTRDDTELRICNKILVISQNIIRDGREVPCCSIIRNLSDVDALTCLCNSVGARRFSFSPNINNFFRACGRKVPQGFSCPGPLPTIPPSPPLTPPPPANIPPPLPLTTPPPPPLANTPPPPLATTPPPPSTANTPPPPLATTPPPPPLLDGICTRNDTELMICNRILVISQNIIRDGREVPCCSIISNLSDVDALTCLCNSVGARRFSFSPNINNFFGACGRRVPQGFSCPGPLPPSTPPPPTVPLPASPLPSTPPPPGNTPLPLPPTTPPPPAPPTLPPQPPATNTPLPLPPTTPPPPPPLTTTPPPPPLDGICTRNDTELMICNRILVISQNIIRDGREVPCCSIIRNLSDVDALTCLCKSVGARRFSFSPNINNFFRACGRRVPQGFSCPGPSPTIPPSPSSNHPSTTSTSSG